MPKTNSVTDKPLNRVALKRLRTQEEILDTALEVLSEQGVEGLTLAAVADRLGFTKPALYHYFRSKETLLRSLILQLIRQETLALLKAVENNHQPSTVLGALIRAFYQHYRNHLNIFRLVYCQFQLMDVKALGFDKNTMQQNINPQTHRLFDAVVAILGAGGKTTVEMRQLAFSAWLSAVGLVEMIAIVDSANDTLRHSDEALLGTLENVFNAAAERIIEA